MAKSNGAIIYRGPSMLDGQPIMVVVTGLAQASSNAKTGDMLQTWILRDDVEPHTAVKTGQDESVCGDCPHRGTSCYVTIFQAPLAVYRAAKRGSYPVRNAFGLAAERGLRIGSYGDPAAVPTEIWHELKAGAAYWTGYTHQWRTARGLQPYCMASCDTAEEMAEAKALGWRVFRVRKAAEPMQANEISCPASKEAGAKTVCASCKLCMGTTSKSRKTIAIMAHGSKAKINAFEAA